jgi:hypothetical protein
MSDSLVEANNNKVKKTHPMEYLDLEIKSLNASYKGILDLANTISNTLLIKNNKLIIQVKAIHQHYLYTDENGLTEVKSSAKSAIEIGQRADGRSAGVTSLYTITFNPKESVYELINEQVETKPTLIKKEDKNYIGKIISFLVK